MSDADRARARIFMNTLGAHLEDDRRRLCAEFAAVRAEAVAEVVARLREHALHEWMPIVAQTFAGAADLIEREFLKRGGDE